MGPFLGGLVKITCAPLLLLLFFAYFPPKNSFSKKYFIWPLSAGGAGQNYVCSIVCLFFCLFPPQNRFWKSFFWPISPRLPRTTQLLQSNFAMFFLQFFFPLLWFFPASSLGACHCAGRKGFAPSSWCWSPQEVQLSRSSAKQKLPTSVTCMVFLCAHSLCDFWVFIFLITPVLCSFLKKNCGLLLGESQGLT